MILRLQKYQGNFIWSESFDYELNENDLVQVNNNGTGRYHLYKKIGRPKIIHYHQDKRDWEHFDEWLWRRGSLFFANEEQIDFLVEWAAKKKIFTLEQPEKKVL